MKTRIFWLVIAVMLVTVPEAVGQDVGRTFGIGLSISTGDLFFAEDPEDVGTGFLPLGLGDIYLSINASDQIKVEPQLGLFRYSQEYEQDQFRSKETVTVWRLGTGVFYRIPATESLSAYVGPRFLILWNTRSAEFNGDSNDVKRTDFAIGAALGGEYFFSGHFSLGGELQVNYVAIGEPDSLDDSVDLSTSLISNNGVIFLRWYF